MPEPSALELYIAASTLPLDKARVFVAESNCSDETKEQVLARLNTSCDYFDNKDARIRPIGAEIEHYVITGELGRGGMGVVYSARDTRLGREVALKFLSTIKGRAVDILEREARTASSLNHPNIVTVHEVVRSGSGVAIVMEKVDGVSLRRLIGNRVPLSRAIDIGRQVASAVAAAHSKGIVHRDLKPENVMVRADGYVKVLDFGLARHTTDGAILNASALSTIAGTLRYMSPEQAKAESLTAASDVYSLGLMLYELCTGTHPFALEPPPAGVHARAASDPQPMTAGDPRIPEWLNELLSIMLRRDPYARPSIREVAEALSGPVIPNSAAGSDKAVTGSFGSKKGRWRKLLLAIAASGALGFIWYLGWFRTPDASVVDTRVDLGTPAELEEEGFALSPDGRTLLFVAGGHLNHVSLEGGSAQPWKGAERGRFPFWSPDGKDAGFHWNGKIWRRRFPNGVLQEVCSAVEPLSASWGSRGTIVFSAGDGPIFQVPASGGTPTAITRLSGVDNSVDTSPTFLPDGSRFLFFRKGDTGPGSLMLGATDKTQAAIRLASTTTSAVYLPHPGSSGGALVYGQERRLLAHPFNPSTGTFTGGAVVLTEQAREFRRRVIPASAAASGAFVYAEAEDKTDQPKIFDRRGQLLAKLGQRREYVRAVPSPDFERFALVSREPGTVLYSLEILARRTGKSYRLDAPGRGRLPVWSRDGKRIVYTDTPNAAGSLATIQSVPPIAPPETLRLLPYRSWLHDWSPNGKLLLVTADISPTDRSIWAFPLDRSKLPAAIIRTPGKNDEQHWSPDGRFIAYQSNESGQTEIYVVPFPSDGRKWQVSTGGGQEPRWRADGKELYYLSLDYALMCAKTSTGTKDFTSGRPARLFGGRSSEPALMVWHAEPSPDGQQFVILVGGRSRGSALRLRLNWWATSGANASVR